MGKRRGKKGKRTERKILKRVLTIVSAAILMMGTALGMEKYREGNEQETGVVQSPSEAEIHFIDVGQGDATLITCDGHSMLIDAGENDKGTALQLYLTKQGIEKLDYLVLTHPDADHIGGADVMITKFDIGSVFMSDYEKDNKTYRDVLQALEYRGLDWSVPEPGESYALGSGSITFLAPVSEYTDPNNSSIALLFCNGKNSFLFTGDAQEEAEMDILGEGFSVRADVYKAGHHGSDTSSCEEFLRAVKPKYAVISCGEGNSYGHPHSGVLNSLRAMGVKLFRTDEQGSIIARSDGEVITWNCAPSETWQTGERTDSGARQEDRTEEADIEQTEEDSGTREQNQAKEETGGDETEKSEKGMASLYIGNRNNGKLHRCDCKSLPKEENQIAFSSKEEAIGAGYADLCGSCNP